MNNGAVRRCPKGTLGCVNSYPSGFPPYLGSELFIVETPTKCIVVEVKALG